MTNEEIKQWYIDNGKIYFSSIELTQNCNFNCKHCYCPDKVSKNLSTDQIKTLIDKICQTGCLFLTLTGGEILTRKDFGDIFIYSKKRGFIVDLMTNGSLIDDSTITLFKDLPPRNISITLYGSSEEEYEVFTGNKENYNKVMNALHLLNENRIPFVLRTIAGKTLRSAIENKRFETISEMFSTSFRYDPIIFPKTSGEKTPLNESLSPQQIVDLEKSNNLRSESWSDIIRKNEPFKWKCNAGTNSLAVDYAGNAFVCGLYRKEPISLLDNDVSTVLSHLRSIHQRHQSIMETSECNTCKYRNICKWCPAYSLVYNNSETERVDFFCELSRLRYEAFSK